MRNLLSVILGIVCILEGSGVAIAGPPPPITLVPYIDVDLDSGAISNSTSSAIGGSTTVNVGGGGGNRRVFWLPVFPGAPTGPMSGVEQGMPGPIKAESGLDIREYSYADAERCGEKGKSVEVDYAGGENPQTQEIRVLRGTGELTNHGLVGKVPLATGSGRTKGRATNQRLECLLAWEAMKRGANFMLLQSNVSLTAVSEGRTGGASLAVSQSLGVLLPLVPFLATV